MVITGCQGETERSRAAGHGKEPQEITLRGVPAVVVLSRQDYDRLTRQKDAESLVDFMRRSPLYGEGDLKFERDQSPTREVDL